MVQFTPPGSEASIHIGNGITSAAAGSLQNVYLIVSDIESARAYLISGGVDVSEVFHYDGLLGPKVSGPDPKRDPTARSLRSKIPMATAGYCRKLQRDFQAVNGSKRAGVPQT